MAKSLNTFLTVRVSGKTRTSFNRKAERFGRPADIMRELIEAFIDDRIVIQPDPKKEFLYVPRKEA